MGSFTASPLLRALLAAAIFVVVTVVAVAATVHTIDPAAVCPDFIQFWTAASLLGNGQNPYDPALQAATQQALGWQREASGLGVYDFLPYYYPPWLGLAFLPLLPLGYAVARLTWLVLGFEMLLASAWLLQGVVRRLPAPLTLVTVAIFGFSIKAVAMGQVAPLVLLLVAAAWRLLDARRDAAAGCALALLTIKPQLSVLLLLVVLGWCLRRGRTRVLLGFAVTVVVLATVSTFFFVGWLPAMVSATQVTPMPTAYYPGLGTTWYVALGAVGLHGPPLYVAYSAVAVPLLLSLLRMANDGRRPLEDLFGVALIAPFFLVPYARPYDFPVLLVPALILMGTRLSDVARAALAIVLAVLPSVHILHMIAGYVRPQVGVRRPEFLYFWIPIVVALVWLCCPADAGREKEPAALRDEA